MEEVAKIMRTGAARAGNCRACACLEGEPAGVFEFNDPIWSGVSESVRSLIKLMLTLDPAGRPSAKQVRMVSGGIRRS